MTFRVATQDTADVGIWINKQSAEETQWVQHHLCRERNCRVLMQSPDRKHPQFLSSYTCCSTRYVPLADCSLQEEHVSTLSSGRELHDSNSTLFKAEEKLDHQIHTNSCRLIPWLPTTHAGHTPCCTANLSFTTHAPLLTIRLEETGAKYKVSAWAFQLQLGVLCTHPPDIQTTDRPVAPLTT